MVADSIRFMEKNAYTYPDVSSLCEKTFSILSRELIGENYIEKLKSFVGLLPQDLNFSRFCLECPLKEGENWGDISFSIDLLTRSPILELSNLPNAWQKCPIWNQLCLFSKACLETNLLSDQMQGIDHWIWAEFDVGSSPLSSHIPSIFLKTTKVRKENLTQVVSHCQPFFGISDASLAVLQKCNEALIGDLKIGFVAFMLPRAGKPLRVCIFSQRLDPSTTVQYLSSIGILDYPSSLINVIKKMRPYADSMGLILDITDNQLSSKIGLEFFFPQQSQMKREEIWRSYFEILSEECSIDMNKLPLSLDWHGHDLEFIGNSIHPPYYFLIRQRDINNMKLVFNPGKEIQAKIYFETILSTCEK